MADVAEVPQYTPGEDIKDVHDMEKASEENAIVDYDGRCQQYPSSRHSSLLVRFRCAHCGK